MAQQTQAARAGAAWTRFMARFPTVVSLADATPADVLRAWQGLGYNRRALDLWRTARLIVAQFEGRVPSDILALQSLPGVGPYTARAVAAIAFGQPVGAVDTNVRRVLGRIVAGEGASTPAALQRLADDVVPADRPGDWTHALMDLGATVCRARPDCAACPASPWCRYMAVAYMAEAAGHTVENAPRSVATARAGRSSATPTARIGRPVAATSAVRETQAPFRTTSRWLRGRILDCLRDAPDGEWVALDGSVGEHDRPAVEVAARALAIDGLLELDEGAPPGLRARLPIA
jgi:A/G-specific adenine glycosylase